MFRPILDVEAVDLQGPEHILYLLKVHGPFRGLGVDVSGLGDADADHHVDVVQDQAGPRAAVGLLGRLRRGGAKQASKIIVQGLGGVPAVAGLGDFQGNRAGD